MEYVHVHGALEAWQRLPDGVDVVVGSLVRGRRTARSRLKSGIDREELLVGLTGTFRIRPCLGKPTSIGKSRACRLAGMSSSLAPLRMPASRRLLGSDQQVGVG
jgi:hypothetical protein